MIDHHYLNLGQRRLIGDIEGGLQGAAAQGNVGRGRFLLGGWELCHQMLKEESLILLFLRKLRPDKNRIAGGQ